MNIKTKRIAASAALILALTTVALPPACAASTGHYRTYATIASVKDRDGCCSMQGMAVDSGWIYTVKINSGNSRAFLCRTNRSSGSTTPLTDAATGSIYLPRLGHANDMDVTTIDGKPNLFIATMNTGSLSLVRMEVRGSEIAMTGSYRLRYHGENRHISGIAITGATESSIDFLFKRGCTFYTGSIHPKATDGTIQIKKAFRVDLSRVSVGGKERDLSNYIHQGFGYYGGRIFLPLTGPAGKRNSSVILVYGPDAQGRMTLHRELSFQIKSREYPALFEIESCGISPDGRLYFNTNRRKSDSSINHDGIHYFKGYSFDETYAVSNPSG